MSDDDRDTRIRERAYFLWLGDGQPNGQAEEYWHRAIAAEQDSEADEASEESFPASDPPANSGITGTGGPA
jgi:hypothetical protein